MTSSVEAPFTLKAFRFALRCKPAQERQLARWSGQLRWIWNKALAEQRARHARGEKYASYVDMAKWLTSWRNAEATAWLAEGPAQPQQHVLKRLDDAYKRFFKKAGGFPSFKRYGFDPGIRFPDPKQFELDQSQVGKRSVADQSSLPHAERKSAWDSHGCLKLPKLGWARLRLSQQVEGEIRNVSLSKEGSRWFVSIQTRIAACQPAAGLAPTLGIDLGVASFAATSQSALVEPLNALKRQQQRLRRYQRAVSRKIKGSCNRKKAVKRLTALHRRIANQRSDWLHKLTTSLANEHAVIAIEDLKVANMSASARGTAAAPGKNVKAKAGLNRSILDQGWSEFRRQLEYKLEANGGQLIAVNPAYTSQTCSACGHCEKGNRQSQTLFACVACGHTEHADINAAKNILAAGLAASACGEAIRPCTAAKQHRAASVKQEPTEAFKLVQETECV
jgi:putative transposase